MSADRSNNDFMRYDVLLHAVAVKVRSTSGNTALMYLTPTTKHIFLVDYSMTLSVYRQYSVDDRLTGEYGAAAGMRAGRKFQSTRKKLDPIPLFHHKSHMT
jgi:hypothetical protein